MAKRNSYQRCNPTNGAKVKTLCKWRCKYTYLPLNAGRTLQVWWGRIIGGFEDDIEICVDRNEWLLTRDRGKQSGMAAARTFIRAREVNVASEKHGVNVQTRAEGLYEFLCQVFHY